MVFLLLLLVGYETTVNPLPTVMQSVDGSGLSRAAAVDTNGAVPRLLLLIALICGLVPALGETVELAVHYAATGHVAHLEPGETDLGSKGKEHGCGPTDHHCGCCASQPVLLPPDLTPVLSLGEPGESLLGPEEPVAQGVLRRMLRPPIPA